MSSIKRRVFCAFALWIFALSLGCKPSSRNSPTELRAAQPEPVPHNREADDLARFIAGIPGSPDSPFAALESTPAWEQHRRALDDAWKKAQGPLIEGIGDFGKTELASLRKSPVFYPFSGPDALTAVLDFPNSPTYVMVGLEPAGTLPTVAQLKKKDLATYLAAIRNTVASELGRSFFVTRQMDRQFRGQVTDGLLVPILHLLVRTHNTILGFRYVRLDDDGEVIGRASDYHAPGRIGNKGIEIEFRSDPDQAIHQLYYFSVNLSDERLRENKPFLEYISRQKGVVTLLKATSYMTHHKDFSIIRDQILANSTAVLQDDSGIPYRFFQANNWKVALYGDYRRPYGSFRWMEQPDLRKAYESGEAKPLSLRLGYGYSRITSNLLLAQR